MSIFEDEKVKNCDTSLESGLDMEILFLRYLAHLNKHFSIRVVYKSNHTLKAVLGNSTEK